MKTERAVSPHFPDQRLSRSRPLCHARAAQPVLSFIDAEMPSRLSHIDKLGIERSQHLPAAFDPESMAMLVAPEGTTLLLMTGDA